MLNFHYSTLFLYSAISIELYRTICFSKYENCSKTASRKFILHLQFLSMRQTKNIDRKRRFFSSKKLEQIPNDYSAFFYEHSNLKTHILNNLRLQSNCGLQLRDVDTVGERRPSRTTRCKKYQITSTGSGLYRDRQKNPLVYFSSQDFIMNANGGKPT